MTQRRTNELPLATIFPSDKSPPNDESLPSNTSLGKIRHWRKIRLLEEIRRVADGRVADGRWEREGKFVAERERVSTRGQYPEAGSCIRPEVLPEASRVSSETKPEGSSTGLDQNMTPKRNRFLPK